MRPNRQRKGRQLSISWTHFFRYLIKELVSILLCPLLTFGISALAEAISNLESFDIRQIFRVCFHNDMLLSVLSVYIILYWGYETDSCQWCRDETLTSPLDPSSMT